MSEITRYIVVAEPTKWKFEDVMNENIELGWQPYGSLCHHEWAHDGSERYVQPMVKYDEGEQ